MKHNAYLQPNHIVTSNLGKYAMVEIDLALC